MPKVKECAFGAANFDELVKSHFSGHCEEWDSSPVFARLMKSAEAISKQASEQAPQSNNYKQLTNRRLLRFARNDGIFDF